MPIESSLRSPPSGRRARSPLADHSLSIRTAARRPEAHYGRYYKSVSILPRSDGIVVQYVGDSDKFGVGIADGTPDRGEAERVIATIAPLIAGA
jgi:hypothetical protein